MDPASIMGGIALLFVLPGYLLLQALFPQRRWFGPFHAIAVPTLSVVTSVAILVVVGTVLGFLPGGPGDKGWFQGNQSGAPVLEIVLGALSFMLLGVAVWRGAFPLLRAGRPYDGWTERSEPEEVTLLRDLRLEEARLTREVRKVTARARRESDAGVQRALQEAAGELARRRDRVTDQARQLEHEAGVRRYGPDRVW